MLTVDIFFAFWQKVSPDLAFPVKQAGDEASYNKWTEGSMKYYGTRKLGQKHGIVRTIAADFITEATWYENKRHGLAFTWFNDNLFAFMAKIFDHGEFKAEILWSTS